MGFHDRFENFWRAKPAKAIGSAIFDFNKTAAKYEPFIEAVGAYYLKRHQELIKWPKAHDEIYDHAKVKYDTLIDECYGIDELGNEKTILFLRNAINESALDKTQKEKYLAQLEEHSPPFFNRLKECFNSDLGNETFIKLTPEQQAETIRYRLLHVIQEHIYADRFDMVPTKLLGLPVKSGIARLVNELALGEGMIYHMEGRSKWPKDQEVLKHLQDEGPIIMRDENTRGFNNRPLLKKTPFDALYDIFHNHPPEAWPGAITFCGQDAYGRLDYLTTYPKLVVSMAQHALFGDTRGLISEDNEITTLDIVRSPQEIEEGNIAGKTLCLIMNYNKGSIFANFNSIANNDIDGEEFANFFLDLCTANLEEAKNGEPRIISHNAQAIMQRILHIDYSWAELITSNTYKTFTEKLLEEGVSIQDDLHHTRPITVDDINAILNGIDIIGINGIGVPYTDERLHIDIPSETLEQSNHMQIALPKRIRFRNHDRDGIQKQYGISSRKTFEQQVEKKSPTDPTIIDMEVTINPEWIEYPDGQFIHGTPDTPVRNDFLHRIQIAMKTAMEYPNAAVRESVNEIFRRKFSHVNLVEHSCIENRPVSQKRIIGPFTQTLYKNGHHPVNVYNHSYVTAQTHPNGTWQKSVIAPQSEPIESRTNSR